MKKRIILGNNTKVNINKNANGKFETMPISTMSTNLNKGIISKNVMESDVYFEKKLVDKNHK